MNKETKVVVLISRDELKKLIKDAIRDAINERGEIMADRTPVAREVVAQRLGVDLTTLWRWDKEGHLKPDVRRGRKVFYYESTVRNAELGIGYNTKRRNTVHENDINSGKV
jgi:hypothetical protein